VRIKDKELSSWTQILN